MNVSCCDYEKCQSGMRHLVFICFDNPNPVVALICALSSSCRGWRRGARCYSVAALTAFGEGDVAFFTGNPLVPVRGRIFLFRNYRPDLGKWQTADPLGYPDGWNLLAYCGNEVICAADLYGAITVHNVSFGWFFEWQGFSIAYNPLLPSFELSLPKVPISIWNELAKVIGNYIRGQLSDLTLLWEAFLAVEKVDLFLAVRNVAEETARSWFDNVISVEVTDIELLRVVDANMDVIKNGDGDVYYVQFGQFKVLHLVHIKVVEE